MSNEPEAEVAEITERRIGEKVKCPLCFIQLGEPGMTEGAMGRIMGKHVGSQKCKDNRAYLQSVADDAAARAEIVGGEVVETDELQDAIQRRIHEVARQEVTFTVTSPNFRIWLRTPHKLRGPDGEHIGTDHGLYAQFREGRFTTTDPQIIRLMRKSVHNFDTLQRRHGTAALKNRDDVFIEEKCIELTDDGRIAASA